ncbi:MULTISPECIES: hypothetical protein [unclassified Burkholderia]|uniref:hypothetical protein n=1 Tax=unclassified Burkholderia TaxID=2613784 RepID=UPI002AB0CCED|nr:MULTISPECIES: hypothetical protein [unclassified Burkholderia]
MPTLEELQSRAAFLANLDSRFAEEVVGARPDRFETVEIQSAREWDALREPDAFTVVVRGKRLAEDGEGEEIEYVVGQHGSFALAMQYANELGGRFGWDVHDAVTAHRSFKVLSDAIKRADALGYRIDGDNAMRHVRASALILGITMTDAQLDAVAEHAKARFSFAPDAPNTIWVNGHRVASGLAEVADQFNSVIRGRGDFANVVMAPGDDVELRSASRLVVRHRFALEELVTVSPNALHQAHAETPLSRVIPLPEVLREAHLKGIADALTFKLYGTIVGRERESQIIRAGLIDGLEGIRQVEINGVVRRAGPDASGDADDSADDDAVSAPRP